MALCALVFAGTLPALAAEGRIPIFGPGPIGADGKYVVTRDIFGTGAGPVIDILAPNVDIDLNGFTLTEPAGAFPVINVPGIFVTHLTIRNGSLNFGSLGIEAPVPGDKIVIEDVKIEFPAATGIHVLDILSIAIRRVMIQGGAATGILIDGLAPQTAVIEDSVIRDVGGNGIEFMSGSITVLNNKLAGTGGAGPPGGAITLTAADSSLVSENTIVGSGTEGIFVSNTRGGKLFDNLVQSSVSHGIHLDPGSAGILVLNNVATGNGFGLPGGHGLFVEGFLNHLDRNTLNSNSGYGLFFTGGGSTFGRNMARANGGPAGCPLLFPPNSCDAGLGNSTFGDNLIPGPPVF